MGDFGIFSGLFWGIFLLSAGIIVLLKTMLNLQASSGKLIFGLFILLAGVSLLTSNQAWGKFNLESGNTMIFASSSEEVPMQATGKSNEYNIVFGSAVYNATQLAPAQTVKVNCAFGSCRILIPKDNVYVTASSAFGNVRLPDDNNVSFRSDTYGAQNATSVRIEIHCAFGSVTVVKDE
jgi:hypothetical protein